MAASTFLYGCENWNLIKQEERKMKETEMKAVRSVVWQYNVKREEKS
jgi:hypothetical protein